MQSDSYTIAPIEQGDEDNVLAMLKRTFFKDEPLNEAVGLTDEGDCLELEEYCRGSILSGLSFKAVDKDNHIIGAMISDVRPVKEEGDVLRQADNCKNPKFQKILYIIAMRDTNAKLWEKYPNDSSLVDVLVAATDPTWRRKGIMNKLFKETEKATKDRNIRLLRVDTSSFHSAKAAEKAGYTMIFSIPYTELKRDGKPIIIPKAPHVDDRVYVKELY